MNKKLILLSIVTIFVAASFAKPDIAMEMTKDNIIQNRRALIKANITLTEDKQEIFWALYDEYEKRSKTIMDERGSIITAYAQSYYTLKDEQADALAKRTLKVDAQQLKLEKWMYKQVSKNVSPTAGVQFMQLINRIRMMVNIQVSNQVPMILTDDSPQVEMR